MTAQKSKFNLSIHGLRGLASFSVLLFHVHGMGAKNNLLWSYAEWLLPFGYFFVCIFFCISGFLITQTLEKHNSLRVFAKNRLLRIYPVFLTLHLLMFIFGPGRYDWMKSLKYGSLEYITAFLSNLLFLPGIFNFPIAQKNAWSLSYEALFYILAGIVWKTSTMAKGKVKNICLLVELIIIIAIAISRIEMSFFAIGIGCYLVPKYYPKYLPSTYNLGLLFLIIAAITFTYYRLFSIPFLFIFFLEVVREDGFMSQILKLRIMGFLGTISYSLYLIHPFVMDPIRSIAMKIVNAGYPLLIGDLTLIIAGPFISIIVAWASYDLIERKLTKFILAKI
jgi:peptidoglycan/LPS O-acetylase OafA/YrhL